MVTLVVAEAGMDIRAKVKLGNVNFLRCPMAASEPIVPFFIHLVRIAPINSLLLALKIKEFNKKKRVETVTIVAFSNEVNANSFIRIRQVLKPLH